MIRKLFFLFVFSVSTFFAEAQQDLNPNGYNKFYYENGVLSSEGTMRDGKPDGYWKTYTPEGKIKSEGNRKDFELDSLWKFYDGDGNLLTEINYARGKKNGTKTTWDGKGHIISEEHYEGDIKTGFSFIYHSVKDSTVQKGPLKWKTPFEKGKEHGLAYEYDLKGNLLSIVEYYFGVQRRRELLNQTDKQGKKQGVWKEFYEDGKVKSEVTYLDGKKNGYEKKFTTGGSLASIEKFVGDSLLEEVPELTTDLETRYEYYPSGAVKVARTYLDSLAEGTHKSFDTTGTITWAWIYKRGELIGEGLIDMSGRRQGDWIEYHPEKIIKAKGKYLNDRRIGDWTFYHVNGAVEQKGKYDNKGNPQGLWVWYHSNKQTWREENYLNGKREGLLSEWDSAGALITKGEYIEGMKEGRWFYQLQDYKEEGMYKFDQKDGPWEAWYIGMDQLMFAGSFIEGLPDGKHTWYYPDGKKKEEGKYIMGSKEGNWTHYNPDGTPLITITFRKNREVKFDGVKVKPFLPGESVK